MSKARLDIIDQAFKKLDKTGDGVVTVDDMQGVYNYQRHPQYISGEKTKEDLFKQFLANFEVDGHVDGKVCLILLYSNSRFYSFFTICKPCSFVQIG